MDTNNNEMYRFSFFKPTTKEARYNRNMIVTLVIIWAVAVFGFQFLLRILEKPVPEEALKDFQTAWKKVENNNATKQDKQLLVSSMLSVSGKLMLKPADRQVIDNAISWTVGNLIADTLKPMYKAKIAKFEKQKKEIESLRDDAYIAAANDITNKLAPVCGLEKHSLKAELLALELKASMMDELKPENREKLPGVMEKYTIHNRSVLTDTTFLGFPFHYFYTAVFLLILFVGLCWIYSNRIDAMNKKLGLEQ